MPNNLFAVWLSIINNNFENRCELPRICLRTNQIFKVSVIQTSKNNMHRKRTKPRFSMQANIYAIKFNNQLKNRNCNLKKLKMQRQKWLK